MINRRSIKIWLSNQISVLVFTAETKNPPKIQWKYTEINLSHMTSFVETHIYKFTQITGKQASWFLNVPNFPVPVV